MIERLDIIDPSLLRPNVALLYDDGENFVSIICSEKQGCDAGMQELHRLGMVRSAYAPLNFTVKTGMVSRVFYDEAGKIIGHETLDKFGQPIEIPHGTFPVEETSPSGGVTMDVNGDFNPIDLFRDRISQWRFSEFKAVLEKVRRDFPEKRAIQELTRIYDYLPGWDTGGKDRGALFHIVQNHINEMLDHVNGQNGLIRIHLANAGKLNGPEENGQALVVDARGFLPEGVDPSKVLGCFLDHAHRMGWRRFIVYRVEGQRGIGMGMGSGFTPDTTVDVYGSPGEYCGAFNMGALIRVHNHAQNFTGMVMHSGTLEIHGDVGKVAGYAAKGGTFNILGNVVDRGWVCAVSDPRGPGLEVNIVGTAYEHLCQALMGGSVILLGLYRDQEGQLRRMASPYTGAKILAGASAGEVLFFDPSDRLEKAQYQGCRLNPVDDRKWNDIRERLLRLEKAFGLGFSRENGHLTARIDGRLQTVTPEDFRWIVPTGSLEGYH